VRFAGSSTSLTAPPPPLPLPPSPPPPLTPRPSPHCAYARESHFPHGRRLRFSSPFYLIHHFFRLRPGGQVIRLSLFFGLRPRNAISEYKLLAVVFPTSFCVVFTVICGIGCNKASGGASAQGKIGWSPRAEGGQAWVPPCKW